MTVDRRDAEGLAAPPGYTHVASDPSFRTGAQRIRTEVQALPGPEYAVSLLEELTGAR